MLHIQMAQFEYFHVVEDRICVLELMILYGHVVTKFSDF